MIFSSNLKRRMSIVKKCCGIKVATFFIFLWGAYERCTSGEFIYKQFNTRIQSDQRISYGIFWSFCVLFSHERFSNQNFFKI